MKANSVAVLLAAFWLALPSTGHGAEPKARPDIAALAQWLGQRQKDSGVVGISAALVVDGKVVWKQGFGFADRNAGIAMSPRYPGRHRLGDQDVHRVGGHAVAGTRSR